MTIDLLGDLDDTVRQALAPAINAGILRPLDLALIRFLAAHTDTPCSSTLIAAAWCSQQLGNGHVCLPLTQACDDPLSLLPERTRDSKTRSAQTPVDWWRSQSADPLARTLAASPLVDASAEGQGQAPLVLDGTRLYLRRNWRDETDVSRLLRARLDQHHDGLTDLPARLDALFPDSSADTDWQKVACALAARNNLTLITGGPGTGKTTTVVRLLALLQQLALEQGRPLRARLAAPTGKAAARLTSSIGTAVDALPVSDAVRAAIPTQVSTLHKLLGSRPDSRRFRHHADNPLHADLVVVDEASMIDLDMMASLLRALDPHTRLVLLGDKDQLASVEAGAVMGDLCQGAQLGQYTRDTIDWVASVTGMDISHWAGPGSSLAQHTAMLRTSHRFQADSGIGALASAVNAGDAARCQQVWQAGHADICLREGSAASGDALMRLCVDGYRPCLETLHQQRPASADGVDTWARAVLASLEQFQLLCAVRQGPAGIQAANARITRALFREKLIAREDGWYQGRPVMVTRNDYQSGLMNGDVGITLDVPQADGSSRLRVAFLLADGSLRFILPSRLDQVETTYAMTVHKSQGSEFMHTVLLLPDECSTVTRELLYTAITRARQRFTLVSPRSGGWQAPLERPTRRASGLAQRLHR